MSENSFEKKYFEIRKQENRIYSDEEVVSLPDIKKSHPHFSEWEIRKASFNQLKIFLRKKNKPLFILDIGCGNGWMGNKLTELNNSWVTGMDVNGFEMEQAGRVFKNNRHLEFIYSSPMNLPPGFDKKFDIILLAASVQYFPDLKLLINQLFSLLKENGEIHFTDTHFYSEKEIQSAKQRSRDYFKRMEQEEMDKFYYHHAWNELKKFNFKIRNRSWIDWVKAKIFGQKANFFPWIIIKK